MEPERWLLIKQLFQAALECQPGQRGLFLTEACAGDDSLRREIELLLAQEEQANAFLETPALEIQARLLAQEDRLSTAIDQIQLKEGDLVSHYRIVSLLGRGGMGEVYLAEDVRFERKVAIKLLRGEWTNDAERVRRFELEARAASALNHPNIVTVHDIGQAGAIRFITTEFVDGQTLRQMLKSGRLGMREALDIGLQVAAALVAAHGAGIVHRDIKPENVMVRGDGYVKVLDFGIAKRTSSHVSSSGSAKGESITATGTVIGTAGYMSPEQARGQELDARTDVFSLGVLIYEMVTGKPPFSGETQADVVAEILMKEPQPLVQTAPETPGELEQLVARALRKIPEERYQTSGELLAELRRLKETSEFWEKTRRPSTPPPAPDEVEDDSGYSPLMSEFDFSPRLQNWLRRNPHGGKIALCAAAGALIAILLSCFVDAACIRITFQPACRAESHDLIFGYAAELNAGLLYLGGVPLFIYAGFHLLDLAHVMLRRLVSGKRLIVARRENMEVSPPPLEIFSRRNRRLCRWAIPFFVLSATALICIGEYSDRNRLAFGWVQALSLQDLSGKELRQIRQEKITGEIPVLSKLEADNPDCVIRVSNVTGGHGKNDRAKWLFPFLILVAIALGLQIAFIVFGLWLTTKIVFLFVLLSYALLDRPRQTFKIVLDYEDEKKRFGLSALDIIHNAFLTIILAGSIIVLLQQITNVAKGTSYLSGNAGWSLTGQLLLFFIALFSLVLLLLLPVLIFIRLIETAVGRHLERIDGEEAGLRKALNGEIPAGPGQNPGDALKTLKYKRELARQQRPWPRENLIYRRLMLVNIVLLIALLSNSYIGTFENTFISTRMHDLSDHLCAFCSGPPTRGH